MRKSRKKIYEVYAIYLRRKVIYIGMTCDRIKRQKTHSYLYKKGFQKQLYEYLRAEGFSGEITLKPLMSFRTKTEAKRYEMLLILQDYFGKKELKQSVPSISK